MVTEKERDYWVSFLIFKTPWEEEGETFRPALGVCQIG